MKTISKIPFISFIFLLISLLYSNTLAANDVVSAYLVTPFKSAAEVNSSLASNGFKVVAQHNVASNKNLISIVYTSPELMKLAKKKNRGFAAVLKLVINADKKEIRIQNPEYFLHAFMQKEYDPSVAKLISTKLEKSLGKGVATKDVLKKKKLAKYHFMMAMPYYNDDIELSEGNNKELLQKYEDKIGNSHLFKINLGEGKYLLGVNMGKDIEGFVNTIGTENALLLPYTILIENEVAKILHPKYYIALSYPLLSMGEFMKIRSVPGKIEDYLEKYFN